MSTNKYQLIPNDILVGCGIAVCGIAGCGARRTVAVQRGEGWLPMSDEEREKAVGGGPAGSAAPFDTGPGSANGSPGGANGSGGPGSAGGAGGPGGAGSEDRPGSASGAGGASGLSGAVGASGGPQPAPAGSAAPAAVARGAYEARKARTAATFAVSIVVLLALFVVSLGVGRSMIAPGEVVGILGQQLFGTGGDYSQGHVTIVMNVRLPRICAAMLCGAALALAGAAYQGLFKNPMVSPDILGASAGASFGAALAILLTTGAKAAISGSAFAMGFAAVMITYFASKRVSKGSTNMTLLLVLCGLIVQTLFQSFVSIIKYVADPNDTLPTITYWLMGSIAKVTWSDLAVFMVPFLIGAVPLLLLRWRLNTLAFGDAEAEALGVNVKALRGVLIFCSTLLTASVVAIAGVIGWVGLIIPHIVRFISGPDNRTVMPLSLVFGAGFLVIVDTCCRTLMSYEIPLGILTSIIGAPFFFIILMRTSRSGGGGA